MTSPSADISTCASLAEQRVTFVGKMAGMPRREAQALVRQQGAAVVDPPDANVDLIVVGEHELLGENELYAAFDGVLRQAVEQHGAKVITETQLWQRLGLVEHEQNIHRLYTPAMLADLLRVPVSVIRRWHRKGLIKPAREVRRLPYFDFQEVATARRLAELLAAGNSPAAIEKTLATLARFVKSIERPLAQLSVIVEGKQLLLRQGDGLVEPGGQLRFDFGAEPTPGAPQSPIALHTPDSPSTAAPATLPLESPRPTPPNSPQELRALASDLEDAGKLAAAADTYRAALAAGGPNAEICFLLAELLYQLGDVGAARERYYMAIELDEDYVEARANLGCVLAESGQLELAVAAFEGALAFHDDYPDVHYHLARALDEMGQNVAAAEHWDAFRKLAPDSPWADEAQARLEGVEATES